MEFSGEYVFVMTKLKGYIFDSYTSSVYWFLMLLSVGSEIAGRANTLNFVALELS